MNAIGEQRYFDGDAYKVGEVWCQDGAWKCSCGHMSASLQDLDPVEDCALTPGDPSPAGRCPSCAALVSPETRLHTKNWVLPVPVLSTRHIQEETSHFLNKAAASPLTTLDAFCAAYPEGWFLQVPHPDLQRLFAWARTKSYDWIRLDSVGDELPEILTYTW